MPPYKVERAIGPGWDVIDTTNGMVVSWRKEKEAAEKRRDALEADPTGLLAHYRM